MPVYPALKNGSPVEREGVPVFVVRVYDKATKRQINRRVVGENAALAAEADLLAQIAASPEIRAVETPATRAIPRVTNASTLTVHEWALIYLESYKTKPDGSARPYSSWAHDRQMLSTYVIPTLGRRTVASITLVELDDLVRTLTRLNGKPLSGHTRESISGSIKRMFKAAVRRGALTANPAADLSSSWGGQSVERQAVIPSVEDVYRLAASADEASKGAGDIVQLLAFTGLRWGELSGLLVDDVDFKDQSIQVQRAATYSGNRRHEGTLKSKAAHRFVPVVAPVEPALRRLIATGDERREQSNFVGPRYVVTARHGEPFHYSTWRKVLAKAQEASGVSYTAHTLRHVAASLCTASGMTDHEVASVMGHSSAQFTRRIYGHLFPRDGRIVANKLTKAVTAMQKEEKTATRRLVSVKK